MNWKTVSVNVVGTRTLKCVKVSTLRSICCELNEKCICFIFTTDTESDASLNNKSAVEEITMCITLIILL